MDLLIHTLTFCFPERVVKKRDKWTKSAGYSLGREARMIESIDGVGAVVTKSIGLYGRYYAMTGLWVSARFFSVLAPIAFFQEVALPYLVFLLVLRRRDAIQDKPNVARLNI